MKIKIIKVYPNILYWTCDICNKIIYEEIEINIFIKSTVTPCICHLGCVPQEIKDSRTFKNSYMSYLLGK